MMQRQGLQPVAGLPLGTNLIDFSLLDQVLAATEKRVPDIFSDLPDAPRAAPKHGDCHHNLEITDKQRWNLRTLALFLWDLVPEEGREFNMNTYVASGVKCNDTDCGAVGCAVGWAPRAGIKKKKTEDWDDYHRRVFGSGSNIDLRNRLWSWCFDYHWHHCDNTPRGAAERILYALEHGVPCDWKERPLFYKTGGNNE